MDVAEKRKFERHAWRSPCTFLLDGRQHRGFVTDASARGFFLQTTAQVSPGMEIVATLDVEGGAIELIGSVSRTRGAHRETSALGRPGVGVEIQSAPEEYYRLILSFESKD